MRETTFYREAGRCARTAKRLERTALRVIRRKPADADVAEVIMKRAGREWVTALALILHWLR